jgi:hypothetical protein
LYSIDRAGPSSSSGSRFKQNNVAFLVSSEDEEEEEDCSTEEEEDEDESLYYFMGEDGPTARTLGGKLGRCGTGGHDVGGGCQGQRSISAITNCPISIKWLQANFEYAPGKSLPRGFVYDQYVVLCEEHSLDPVNAASFGKLIRCVFPGLKTRR